MPRVTAQHAMGAALLQDRAARGDRTIAVVNGCVASRDGLVERCNVLIRGERIAAVGRSSQVQPPAGAETLDATGQLVLPGFIDLHVPVLMRSGRKDVAAHELAGELARAGTTRFVSAIALSSPAPFKIPLRAAKRRERDVPGAQPLGLRVEALLDGRTDRRMSVAGAKQALRQARAVCPAGRILLTVFAGAPGAPELIRWAAGEGMVVGMTAANADYQQGRQAIEAGTRYVAGAIEALDCLHHREPGAIAAALLDDRVAAELQLSDAAGGLAAAGFVVQAKGAERCVLVRSAGARDGNGMLRAVARAAELPGVGVLEASRMASGQPAALCGIGKSVGSIAEDMTADLVVATREFEVVATVVGGAVAYQRDAA